MAFLEPNVNAALRGAPDLMSSPALALAAGQDEDPIGAGQTLMQTQNVVAQGNALKQHAKENGDGWVHGLLSGLGHAAEDVGHVALKGLEQLGRPLGDVQHDYRYIRDVYRSHGWFAGAAESLGIVAGAAIGARGGPVGAMMGADLVASAEQRLFFHDSAERTRDGEKYLIDGHKVSFGRDIARLVGQDDTDHGAGKVISGLADLTFDFTADPLIGLGKLSAMRKSAEGFTGVRAYKRAVETDRSTALRSFVDRFAPGMNIELGNVDKLDKARTAYSGYRNALKDIARLDAGGVVSKYGLDLQGVADELGKAKTADAVHDVFRRAAFDEEFNARLTNSALPSRSLLRAPFSAAVDRAKLWEGPGQKVMRTFTGYMPYAIDRGTLDLSRTSFNPLGTDGLQGIYRTMRYSMGERAARDWTSRFAYAPNLGTKKAIYAEAVKEMYKAAGLPDDHLLMQRISDLTEAKVAGDAGTELYGYGRRLKDGVSAVTHDGGTDQLGLYAHQKGNFSFPDFFELKGAIRDMGAVSRVYGKVDDFTAHHYTNGFFKPLALLTMGFGLRVAASEAIPGVFRYGAAAMLSNAVAANAASLKYKLAQGEESHVVAAASRLVGGIDNLINDAADRDLAMRITLRNEGHFVKGVASTGENSLALPDDATERAKAAAWYLRQRKARVPHQRDTESWQALTRDADQYQDYWLTGLQKRSQETSGKLIAADLRDAHARGLDEHAAFEFAHEREAARIAHVGEGDVYAKERGVLARYGVQDAREFAAHRVDDMQNHLIGDDGTFHDELAALLAEGKKPTRAMLDAIDAQARPGAVVGNPMVPYIGGNLLNRAVQEGFKRLVDPAINHISREPIFFAAVKENMKALQRAVDKGILTEEEALTRAMYRGSLDMLPQIHNVALRSQFAQLLRNYLPFYFAQEQALKRVGYLISKKPNAFRQYQLIEHGLSDPGFVHTDDQGNRSLMIPLVGEMGKGVLSAAGAIGLPLQAGLPLTVTGDMTSLKTVLPELQTPGVTPLGAIALNKISQLFPEFSPTAKAVVGERGFGQSFQDQIIPNAPLRAIVKALKADEQDRSFSTAFTSALASAAYHGQVPPPDASPAEQQAFIDRLKNNTRSIFFLKAILATFSPLSPRVSQEDQGLNDEFRALVKEKGGYAAGVQEFLKRHGDKAVSYTVGKSESTTGVNAPYTKAAIDFINANEALVTSGKTQLAAAFLVPQATGSGDVQTIHEELLRMHLRERRTPEGFREALYVSQGNRQFFADFAKHQEALKAVAGNADAEANETAAWNDYVDGLKIANPIWAADFYSPVKTQRAQQAILQLDQLFASGEAPVGEQTDLVHGLYQDYRRHELAMSSLGSERGLSEARQAERDAWDAYLDEVAKKEPRLETVITSVFKRLGRA